MSAARLAIGPANYAGQAAAWAGAVREHLGVDAWSFSRTSGGFAFEQDRAIAARRGFVERRTRVDVPGIASALEGATHVALDGFLALSGGVVGGSVLRDVRELQERGLRVALIAHGSDVRSPRAHLARVESSWFRTAGARYRLAHEAQGLRNRLLARRAGVPTFVSTPDTLADLPGSTWLPLTVDVESWAGGRPVFTGGRPRVLHLPSRTRPAIKGTDSISRAMRRLASEGLIEYVEPGPMPHAQVVELIQSVDVVIDQTMSDSYGTTSAEAMAAGRIAVASVLGSRARMPQDPPVVDATPADIEQVVRGLVEDPERAVLIAAAGPPFARRWHDGRAAAEALRPFLEG